MPNVNLLLLFLFVRLQAKRKPLSFQHKVFNNQLLWSLRPLLSLDGGAAPYGCDQLAEIGKKLLQSCEPIDSFLEFKHSSNQVDIETGFGDLKDTREGNPRTINQYFVFFFIFLGICSV